MKIDNDLLIQGQLSVVNLQSSTSSLSVLVEASGQLKKRDVGTMSLQSLTSYLPEFSAQFPSIFTIANSTVSYSQQSLSVGLANQAVNTIFAAPNSFGGTPSFRLMVHQDLPLLTNYVKGAGTISASDTILSAIQKLDANSLYTSSLGIAKSGTNNFTPTYGTTVNTIAQGNDSRINNGQTAFTYSQVGHLPLSGGIMSGDIVPLTDNVHSLGSATKMWKDIYVGPGSLYVNGKKVIEDVSNTMNITTSLDQNLAVKTSGAGALQLSALGTGNVEIIAVSGLIQLKGSTMFQAQKLIRSSDGTPLLFDDDINFSSGTGISSQLTVAGVTTLSNLIGTGDRMVVTSATGVLSTQEIPSTVAGNFIQNGTALQTANFNISGNGFFGGNVLIGTTTDNGVDKLQVNGNVKATSFIKTNGTSAEFLKADGSVDSTTYQTPKTTLGGYGITDAAPSSGSANYIQNGTSQQSANLNISGSGTFGSSVTALGGNSTEWNTAYSWGNHASEGYLKTYTDTNTTYTGSLGITLSGTDFRPSYGTAANTITQGNDARLSDARTPLAHTQAFSTITSTPTTLSGYGISDAYTQTAANAKFVDLTSAQTILGIKNFGEKIRVNGPITGQDASGAALQVNGFMRTGNIFLHTGGLVPDNVRAGDTLSNNAGNLTWTGLTTGAVYHSGNFVAGTNYVASETDTFASVTGRGSSTTAAISVVRNGLAASFGVNANAPNATIASQTNYIQIVGGSATDSMGVVFHNSGISTSAFEYINTAGNTGYFNLKSDDADWNARINNNVIWHAGNFVAGTNYQTPLSNVAFTNVNNNFSVAQTFASSVTASTYLFPAPAGDPSPVITARVVPTGQGASNEKSELILFHSNDNANASGVDQITLRAPGLSFQTYDNASVADISNNLGYNERLYISPTGAATFSSSVTASSFASSGSRPITVGNGSITIKGDLGGWAIGTTFVGSSNTNLGGFGAFGGGNTLSYYYIGLSYDTALLKIEPSGAATFSSNVTANGTIRVNSGNELALNRPDNGAASSILMNASNQLIFTSPSGAAFSSSVVATSFSGNGANLTNVNASTLNSLSSSDFKRKHVATIGGISNVGFTKIANITGTSLASGCLVSMIGTADSVVVDVIADILVSHSTNIVVRSLSSFYTIVTLQITSNSNESFTIWAKTTSANVLSAKFEIIPNNGESVEFNPVTTQTAITHEHVCSRGEAKSGRGANAGCDVTTDGNIISSKNIQGNSATFASSVTVGGQLSVGQQKIYFDQSGVRSWGIQVAGGDLNFTSGDALGTFKFNSSVTATAFFATSDLRLKDIVSRDGDTVRFTWKDKRDELIHIGYIAQEVQETYPDQVNEDSNEMLSVNYTEVLVDKVQKLENRLKESDDRFDALEKKFYELINRL